jgi:hypothetical protein
MGVSVMLKDAVLIAGECIKHPGRRAVWSPELQRYVCPDLDEGKKVSIDFGSPTYPPISLEFKLVFVTAAAGTLLFILICVTMTILAGRNPPSLLTEIVRGLFSLAQIGFGAIVGLIGGKRLQGAGRKRT